MFVWESGFSGPVRHVACQSGKMLPTYRSSVQRFSHILPQFSCQGENEKHTYCQLHSTNVCFLSKSHNVCRYEGRFLPHLHDFGSALLELPLPIVDLNLLVDDLFGRQEEREMFTEWNKLPRWVFVGDVPPLWSGWALRLCPSQSAGCCPETASLRRGPQCRSPLLTVSSTCQSVEPAEITAFSHLTRRLWSLHLQADPLRHVSNLSVCECFYFTCEATQRRLILASRLVGF